MPATDIIPIPKELLRKLYFKDKLSMFQIAEMYGCTHSAIVYKFKKYGIKSRGHLGLTKPIGLTKNGFEYLYYRRGLSLRKIAMIAHCSESGLERRFKKYKLVSRGNKNRSSKYKKRDFSGGKREKAYLIGFRLGDLSIDKRVNVIQARCSTTISAQVRLIKHLFSPYTTPHVWKAKRGTFEITCLVNRSFDFLLTKNDEIPRWIQEDKSCFFSFLAGYSDAEGHFGLHKSTREHGNPFGIFEIQTQQKNIIIQIWENLTKYGIIAPHPIISRVAGYTSANNSRNNKDVWRITVARKDSLWKLLRELTPFVRHKDKIKDVQRIKKNLIERGITNKANNPYPRVELELYLPRS